MRNFDLMIIGAGSGNMIPGPEHEDWQIAIVERDKFGGTCLNRGCIPSKMLIHTADVAEGIANGRRFGVHAKLDRVDWGRVVGRVFSDRIDPIAQAGEKFRLGQSNTSVYKGTGRFVDGRVLEVNGEQITADRIVISAGSRPRIPDIGGIESVRYYTSDDVMRLEHQPGSMIILGGGYVGAELGHFFGSLGTEITIIDHGGALIKHEDDDVNARFTELYAERFNVVLNARAVAVRQEGDAISLELDVQGKRKAVAAETLLVASGRVPNSDWLDVTKTGVRVDNRGRILTNEYLETGVPGIWALGDIMSPYPLKHIANMEARVVAHNFTHPESRRSIDYQGAPHAVFASPQVASVGMTEGQARAEGLPYIVGRQDYRATAYGWAIADETGFAKIVAHAETRRILGGHILGPQASVLLQPVVNAIKFGQTVDEVANVIYIHPSLTEVVEQALLNM